MLNLTPSRARATELEARARAIDTQRRRADRAAAAARLSCSNDDRAARALEAGTMNALECGVVATRSRE